jgi:hypothetical protein
VSPHKNVAQKIVAQKSVAFITLHKMSPKKVSPHKNVAQKIVARKSVAFITLNKMLPKKLSPPKTSRTPKRRALKNVTHI